MSVSHGHSGQDFLITFKMVFDNWGSRKITHDTARDLALRSRCMGCDKLINLVTYVQEREHSEQICRQAGALRDVLESTLNSFRPSPRINVWMSQYIAQQLERMLRYMSLLLRGKSKSGKSRKGISLFGHARTHVVNCQGLGANLPSLRGYSRDKHRAILYDECNSRQVLANKLVFQAGIDPVTLGQSACNAHAYEIWLHAVPMILCSNDFQMRSTAEAPMSSEDEEWLASNIIDASLPEGETWYCEDPPAPRFNMQDQGSDDESDYL